MGPDSASETLVTECCFVPKKGCHVHISSPESSLCFLFGFPDAPFILLLLRTITQKCPSTVYSFAEKETKDMGKRRRIVLHVGFQGAKKHLWKMLGLFWSSGWTGDKNQPGNLKGQRILQLQHTAHTVESRFRGFQSTFGEFYIRVLQEDAQKKSPRVPTEQHPKKLSTDEEEDRLVSLAFSNTTYTLPEVPWGFFNNFLGN